MMIPQSRNLVTAGRDCRGEEAVSKLPATRRHAWTQERRPFKSKTGQTHKGRGSAKITVISGSGVSAFASVIDNITNDPTTIAMVR